MTDSKQRKFVGEKEQNYFAAISRELIQDVVSQRVIYYAILNGETEDDIYGESVIKSFAPPIELYARVLFTDPEQKINETGTDTTQVLELYFHAKEVDERGLRIRTGDFVEYAKKLYEIYTVVDKKQPYGEQNQLIEIKVVAGLCRKDQLDLPKHEFQSIVNQYSGSKDVMGSESTDVDDMWSTPPEEEK